MTPQARQCERCRRMVEPRGHSEVRFCPTCGERLDEPLEPAVEAGPGAGGIRRTSVQAVLGLVIAVIALVVQPWSFPLGLISVLLGFTAQRSIERSRGLLGGRGFAVGAIVLGLISLMLWLFIHVLVRPVHHGSASF
jgi:hypothetical protein